MKFSRSDQNGVMLLEALVAILLISFGILGLIALWAASIKNVSEAKYRTDASFLANEIIGQMWLGRAKLVADAKYEDQVPDWKTRVVATLPGGSGKISVVDNAVGSDLPQMQATVTVLWTPPDGVEHNFVSIAQISAAGRM